MPRKKISDDQDGDDLQELADKLPDGEKIVITDQRTIEKKVVSAEPEAKTVRTAHIAETDDDDGGEYFEPPYSASSLAALLDSDDDDFENEFCEILIRREADGFNERFLNPNASTLHLQPMRNVSLSVDKLDIEEKIREIYGGGHYFLQIRYNGRLAKSWKCDLADSPEAIQAARRNAGNEAKTANPPAAEPAGAALTDDERILKMLETQKRIRDLTDTGESQRIADLTAKIEQLQTDAQKQQIESLRAEIKQLVESKGDGSDLSLLLKHADNANFDKLIDRVLPANESSLVRDIVDGAKEILPYGEQIGGFLSGLLKGFSGGSGDAQTAPTEAELLKTLKGETKSPAADEPQSNFRPRRRTAKAEVKK